MLSELNVGSLLGWVAASLVAITFHEAAHGYVAWKRGDPTAHQLGRVTFNPLKHIDPVGTVALPAFMILSGMPFTFGWAKPVPVKFERLNNPRWDGVLVALAGPGINLVLAVCAVALIALLGLSADGFGAALLLNFLMVNLVLAVFNLLPLPPLDGYRVLSGFLPESLSKKLARLEGVGLGLVLIGLFVTPWLLGLVGVNFDPLELLLHKPVMWLLSGLLSLFGLN